MTTLLAAIAVPDLPIGEEHGPTLLGLSSEGWVYVGITIFLILALTWFKFPKLVAEALDKKIAEKRRNLDEAAAIRAEARKLLDEARAQHAQSAKEAEAMLDHARSEAEQIVEQARADTGAMIERHRAMAESKIEAAERAAVADLRREAVGAATGAAHRLIAEKHGAEADNRLADELIGSI